MGTQPESPDYTQIMNLALGHVQDPYELPQDQTYIETRNHEDRPVASSTANHSQNLNEGHQFLPIPCPVTSQPSAHDTFYETQLRWTHGNGRVDQQPISQPELPCTVPDSQPPNPAVKKMSYPGSGSGDTQPVSPSIHESIVIKKSKTALDKPKESQPERGYHLETQITLNEGDEGYVDILSALHEEDEDKDLDQERPAQQNTTSPQPSEPEGPPNPALISPTQIESESPFFQRPKTPITRGTKRDYRGQTVESSTPINPLASFGTPAAGPMPLSQLFKATQAPSSPLPDNLTSDPLSNRPSPNFQICGQASTTLSLSSPTKLPSSAQQPFYEPFTTYKSMKESQAERERRRQMFTDVSRDDDSTDSSDSVFGPEDSIVQRQKRRRRIEKASGAQRSSPTRLGSSGRIRKRLTRSSSPRLPPHRDIGTSSNAIVVPDDEPSTEAFDQHNSSEEETDLDDDLNKVARGSAKKIVASTEEDKENMDSSVLQVPMTTTRTQNSVEDDLLSDVSPILSRGKLRNGAVRNYDGSDILQSPQQLTANGIGLNSSPSVIVPNSQPSQPARSAHHGNAPPSWGGAESVPKFFEGLDIQSSANQVSFIPVSSPPPGPVDPPSSLMKPSEQGHDHLEDTKAEEGNLDQPHIDANNEQETAASEYLEEKHSKNIQSQTSQSTKPERQPGFGSSRLPLEQQSTEISVQNLDQNSETVLETNARSGNDMVAGDLSNGSSKIHSPLMPPPSLPALRRDPSTDSSHYDTARTQFTREPRAQLVPTEQSIQQPSILASPSGKRRRGLQEIAADPTPSNSFGSDMGDVDIGDLMNIDEEFRAAVGTCPAQSSSRKRQRGDDGKPVLHLQSEIEKDHTVDSSPLSSLAASPRPNGNDDNEEIPSAEKEKTVEPDDPATQICSTSRQSKAVWDVSSHSPKRVIKSSKRLQTLRKAPHKPMPQRLMTAATTTTLSQSSNAEGDMTSTHVESPDPLQESPSKSSAPEDTSEVLQTVSDAEIVAPNMVFALFNGSTRAYYPAACLGPAAADQSRFRIKFEDTDLTEIDSHKVKKLDLKVGDTVKVNLEGVPKIPHIIRGFKGNLITAPSLAAQSQQPQVTDVFGHTVIIVAAKQRKSFLGKPWTADEATQEVPISSIYLDNNMWSQLKDHDYTFTALGHLNKFGALDPPSAPVSTPSTPSSRRGRFHNVPRQDHAAMSTLFTNMVFAVSYGEQEVKKSHLTKLILSNGGTIISEGFNELFEQTPLVPLTPTKRSKAVKSSDDAVYDSISHSFKLAPHASTLGFAALITDRHSRREKYLQALALDIPCLSGRWIDDCVNQSKILPWDTYLLPAGESMYLDGAVRSRILSPHPTPSASFAETVSNRPKLLEDQTVLITTGQGRAEEKRKPFVFLTHALGAKRVGRVPDLKAAKAKLEEEKDEWDWIYVDDHEEEAANDLVMADAPSTGKSKKRKRGGESSAGVEGSMKKARVLVNETVVQSLILGRIYEK